MDSDQQLEIKYEKVVKRKIRKLQCKKDTERQFLVASFRKLEKVVNKKRNYTLYHADTNPIDCILTYAKQIKPYSFLNDFGRSPIMSQHHRDNYVGHRRCFRPKVIIDGEIILDDVDEYGELSTEHQKSIFKNGQFHLTLECEQNSVISYTFNGEHPLLADQTERFMAVQRKTITEQPPKHIKIVVTNLNRIESHLTTIIVKQNRNGEQTSTSQSFQNRGIVRPSNNHQLDESMEISDSFKDIDGSSFLNPHQHHQ